MIQAAVFLLAAVIAVPISARLGLGSVLGYLIAGVAMAQVLGPFLTGIDDLHHVAEFGIVMMLFLIGLELEPRTLWDMRHRILGLGLLQIILSAGAIGFASFLVGLGAQTSIAIGFIFSLSSTAIVLQTLTEKRLVQTTGGRSIFSVLLTQDIAVIPMLALLPLLAIGVPLITASPDGSIVRDLADGSQATHGFSLIADLPAFAAWMVTTGVIIVIVLAGMYLTRPLFRYIHAANLHEMYTATALLIVVGIALLMISVGLSPALGTFLAGMVLAGSEFRHELESDLQPFKGLFLGLFFITVGAGMDLTLLAAEFAELLGLSLGVMLIKGGVLFVLATLFRLRGRARWLFTLGLAQAGEFGFVLLTYATQTNVLESALGERMALVVALSMMMTPLFFIVFEILSRNSEDGGANADEDPTIEPDGPIIIAGMGRFGQVVNRMVRSAGFDTTVLDRDLAVIQLMRRFGVKGFFGDPSRPEILRAAGLSEAVMLVVSLDDKDASVRLVQYARSQRPGLHIIERARDRVHAYELYNAGADDIVRETFDSSLRAARYVLENMGLSEFEAAAMERTFFKHDRAANLELASLWMPGVPVEENPAYLERSKQLNADLETALVAEMDRMGENNE